MEVKGIALRSKRAPQFAEVFQCQASPQDIQDDLEKMSRALTRLKKRRFQRSHGPDGLEEGHVYRDSDRNCLKKRQCVVDDDDSDESQSRLMHNEFRHWSKYDPLNYHQTFQ